MNATDGIKGNHSPLREDRIGIGFGTGAERPCRRPFRIPPATPDVMPREDVDGPARRAPSLPNPLATDTEVPHDSPPVQNLRGGGPNHARGRHAALLALFLVAAGCSPSTWIARSMVSAPNRVPDFVKPSGRVMLEWPAGVLERFPTTTNVVGDPPAALRTIRLEPADYGMEVTTSHRTHRGKSKPTFTLAFRLPNEGLPPPEAARGTAFVLHGYGVDLETMFPWAVYLAEAGWRAILVDLRGHGSSGGRQVGFGPLETRDLAELRRRLATEGQVTAPCVVLGHSFGAALALRWQAADPAITASVALGAYDEFVEAATRVRREYARWMPSGWVRRAAGKVPNLLGVEARDLDTGQAIEGRRIRAFLIASADDAITPPEDSARIRSLLAPESPFLVVGGATHETLPYVLDQHGRWVRAWLKEVADEKPAMGSP